jgi:hypothetical protein
MIPDDAVDVGAVDLFASVERVHLIEDEYG